MRLLVWILAGTMLTACNAGAQDATTPRQPTPPGISGQVPFNSHILVDQFGYLPAEQKVAVIRDPHTGYDKSDTFTPGKRYEVRSATDNKAVFDGQPAAWNRGAVEDSSGDSGWWFDFSKLDKPGTYFIYDVDHKVRSATFRIGPDVYRDVLKAAVRMYFYQRAGISKQQPNAPACWNDAPAYIGPNQDTQAHDVNARDDASHVRSLGGGWFDAGDTNKYVTFASTAVHQLLHAYELNPAVFTDDFNIPESGNGVPDLLDEVRWELDWVQRMQYQDGSVALKVGELGIGEHGAPSKDANPRFYIPACSSSTIAAAGMFAHGANVFSKFPALAQQTDALRLRAKAAWSNFQRSAKQAHCDTGVVHAGNADVSEPEQLSQAVVAAVYLYALTGDNEFAQYIAAHYRDTKPYHDIGWSRYKAEEGEALLYYTTLPGADSKLKQTLLADKMADVKNGNQVYGFVPGDDLYRAFMHTAQYHWGSNQVRANYGNTNIDAVAYEPSLAGSGDAYRTRALEILHYFHGVNPFATVYLTNMYDYGATRSLNTIFHAWYAEKTRWSDALTSACGPPPGYVPGGPNTGAVQSGVPATLTPPAGQPPQKSYKDWNISWPDAAWSVNEPGIYYQSAYVRLLSYFVK